MNFLNVLVFSLIASVQSMEIKKSTPVAGTKAASLPITYHGGPVMASVNVYLIWYGTWTNTQMNLATTFLNNIASNSWFKSELTYNTFTVMVKGSYVDKYSLGKSLNDGNIVQIVTGALSSKKLPTDSNGIYFVLTSQDVAQGQFCSSYCGYHNYAQYKGLAIKYSFVGNSARCISACAAQSVSPNGDAGLDGTLNVVAHELVETMSDPLLNAWYDANGWENADKCAWQFGTTSRLPSGARYNVAMGNLKFLLQMNWNRQKQTCNN